MLILLEICVILDDSVMFLPMMVLMLVMLLFKI